MHTPRRPVARSRTRSVLAAVASAGLVTMLVAGCSEDDKADPEKSAKTSGSATPSVDPAKVSPADLPEVPEVKGGQGAVADATFGACATTPGKVSVTGSLTSSAKKTRDYVVTVSWVNATSDVLGRGVHVARGVAPGSKQEFTVRATVPKGATTCTFQVLRGTVR